MIAHAVDHLRRVGGATDAALLTLFATVLGLLIVASAPSCTGALPMPIRERRWTISTPVSAPGG